MDFKIYNTFNPLSKIKNNWNQLLQLSASHVPFLRFEYLQTWWETRGGGEWPEDSQLIIIAAYEDDRLLGAAPLFHTRNKEGKPALMFVGAIEVSDFLDFIALPEGLPDFIKGMLDVLISDQSIPAWEVLDLYNILEDSPSFKSLSSEAEIRGWHYQKSPLQPSPYIPLPDDFETYLAGIDKKQRHEIRRKLRNVEQSLSEGSLYITQSEDQLNSDVETFINMMAQDPNKKDFLTPQMRQHIRNTAQTAFNEGWLQLAFFTLDGGKAAANMSFIFNDRLWLYNSGWDWDFREFSPGWVLLANLIQWAVEQGINEFDFMRGDEDYKYKFGGIDRQIFRVAITK